MCSSNNIDFVHKTTQVEIDLAEGSQLEDQWLFHLRQPDSHSCWRELEANH